MDESYAQVKRTIGALASAVRSREPWSAQLQAEYDEGLRALDAMYATRALPTDDGGSGDE